MFSGKVSKTDIVQSTGTSTTAVMSQKAVSDELNKLEVEIGFVKTEKDYNASDYSNLLWGGTTDGWLDATGKNYNSFIIPLLPKQTFTELKNTGTYSHKNIFDYKPIIGEHTNIFDYIKEETSVRQYTNNTSKVLYITYGWISGEHTLQFSLSGIGIADDVQNLIFLTDKLSNDSEKTKKDISKLENVVYDGKEEKITRLTPTPNTYYNTTNAVIGETFVASTLPFTESVSYKINVVTGEKYYIQGRGTEAVGLFVLVDSNNIVKDLKLYHSDVNIPVVVNVKQDGVIYINDYLPRDTDYVDKHEFVPTEGITSKILNIERSINKIEEDVSAIDERFFEKIEDVVQYSGRVNHHFVNIDGTDSSYSNDFNKYVVNKYNKLSLHHEGAKLDKSLMQVMFYDKLDNYLGGVPATNESVFDEYTDLPIGTDYILYYLIGATNVEVVGYNEKIIDLYELKKKVYELGPETKEMADYSFYKELPKPFNKPIVCFVFDVPIEHFSNSLFQQFVNDCDELGLKLSIATSTNDNIDFRTNIKNYGWFDKIKSGHDIINYPYNTPYPTKVGSAGFGSTDEEDIMAVYDKNITSFDECGIKRNVGVWHNSSERNPCSISQINELYETIVGGISQSSVFDFCDDLTCFGRTWMEDETESSLKSYINSVLGKNKIIVFGTHLVTTNGIMIKGTQYQDNVKPFLEYLSSLVKAGLVYNASITKTIDIVKEYRVTHDCVPFRLYPYLVNNGEVFKKHTASGDKTYKVVNSGVPEVFKLDIGGVAQSGTISFKIDGTMVSINSENIVTDTAVEETKELTITSSMTANDVAKLFYTRLFYSNYRVKVVDNSVYFYRCRTDNVESSFEITNNTSGMTITKTIIHSGIAHQIEEVVM